MIDTMKVKIEHLEIFLRSACMDFGMDVCSVPDEKCETCWVTMYKNMIELSSKKGSVSNI